MLFPCNNDSNNNNSNNNNSNNNSSNNNSSNDINKLLDNKKINAIQIMFSKKHITSDEIKNIHKQIKKFKYSYVHSSFKINIGSELFVTNDGLFNNSINLLVEEILYSNKLNANGIIVHLGKNTRKQYNESIVYNNMILNITELFNKLKKLKKIKIPILIETSSGQGGEMCYDLKDFVNFIISFKNTYFYEYIGICIDTCHIYQAGYDINNDEIIKKVHKILYPIKNKIKLIHLNSSLKNLGMHIDKHAPIGEGYIKTKQLVKFVLPYKKIPMILETNPPYLKQIDLLNSNY